MEKTVKLFIGVLVAAVILSAGAVVTFAVESNYQDTLTKIKILEGYAADYKAANPSEKKSANRLVMNYIRSDKYDSTLWNILAGKKNTGFIEYVASQPQATIVASLKSIDNLILSSGEKIDFVHMFASMDAYANGLKNFGGWYGDLAQIMIEVAKEDGTTYNIKKSYELTRSMINVENTLFNPADLSADLYAYAIMEWLNLNKIYGVSSAMEAYMGALEATSGDITSDSIPSVASNNNNIYRSFIENCLGLSSNAGFSRIASRLALVTVKDAALVTVLGALESQPVRVSSAVRIGARLAFAEFLYNMVNSEYDGGGPLNSTYSLEKEISAAIEQAYENQSAA